MELKIAEEEIGMDVEFLNEITVEELKVIKSIFENVRNRIKEREAGLIK